MPFMGEAFSQSLVDGLLTQGPKTIGEDSEPRSTK
jgi:hypothetical protein